MDIKLGKYALRSTPQQLRDFMQTVLWLDMKDIMEDWREDIRTQLETAEGNDVHKFQGRADLVKLTLVLPQTMLEVLEDDSGRNTTNGEDGSGD